tara:strand:- start:493 stop:693 length:201 start_codon:yes stop_codon:yes gene_type:complete
MSEEQTVNIDGTEYKVADLSKEQVRLVNHVADLDRQLSQLGMNAEQAQVGRNHFMGLLKESLSDTR